MKLENWSVCGAFSPYRSPENQIIQLRGEVHGHPKFAEGKLIWTSPIVSVNGRTITTKNSEYKLGDVDQDYLRWCNENNQHLPIGDNPIKCTSTK